MIRPFIKVFPVPSSPRTQERNPLPVHDSSFLGVGDDAPENAREPRTRREGSRLYTEKSSVVELGMHSGLTLKACLCCAKEKARLPCKTYPADSSFEVTASQPAFVLAMQGWHRVDVDGVFLGKHSDIRLRRGVEGVENLD